MLFMDEPSLGLSPKLVKFMMGHIRKVNREFGDKFVCKDGPVFSLAQWKNMPSEY